MDFGPHALWCFAFERFSGILGSYHTNNKAIESQIMKFCQDQAVHTLDLPSDAGFNLALPECCRHNNEAPANSILLLHLVKDRLNTIDSFACTGLKGSHTSLRKENVQHLTNDYKQLLLNKTLITFLASIVNSVV